MVGVFVGESVQRLIGYVHQLVEPFDEVDGSAPVEVQKERPPPTFETQPDPKHISLDESFFGRLFRWPLP